MQAQTFSPDDIYCVYCHARAAGPCAVCGALCCGDCVEISMGLTTARAVCKSCMAQGQEPAESRLRRNFLVVGAGLALAALAALLFLR